MCLVKVYVVYKQVVKLLEFLQFFSAKLFNSGIIENNKYCFLQWGEGLVKETDYDRLSAELLAEFYHFIYINIKKGTLSESMYHEIELIKQAAARKQISFDQLETAWADVEPHLAQFLLITKKEGYKEQSSL